MAELLKARIRKQEELLDRIKKAHLNYRKSPKERLTVTYIETKTEALEEIWKAFGRGHNEIAGSVETSEKAKLSYFEEDVYTEVEEIYTDYKTKLKDDLRARMPTPVPSHTSTTGTTTGVISISSETQVKLPQIYLPKFSNGYEEWQAFHDMFESLIHRNINLSAVQKLHYLKSCLSGEAETLLKNLSTTEVNYAEAWSQLNRRYNNKRFNANEIMKRLFAQKNVTNESPAALKLLLDTTSACLKSLQNIQIDTSSWDVMINHLIVSKLDPESRKLWELEVSRIDSNDAADVLPTWDQLKKFLEMRFRTLEMLEPCHTYNNKSGAKTLPNSNTVKQTTKPRAFHTSVQDEKKSSTCPMCSGQHALYQCKQFATQTPEKRSEYVQSKGLCFNCLSATHAVKNCHTPTCCRRCSKRHHTLLHFERTSNQDSTTAESSSTEKPSTEASSSNTQHEMRIVAHLAKESHQSRVLLATAMVKIKSPAGYTQIVRALIDQGSEASFISEAICSITLPKEICRERHCIWHR